MAEERQLPPRDDGRMEATPSMERRAPAKVLPVKRMARKVAPLYF